MNIKNIFWKKLQFLGIFIPVFYSSFISATQEACRGNFGDFELQPHFNTEQIVPSNSITFKEYVTMVTHLTDRNVPLDKNLLKRYNSLDDSIHLIFFSEIVKTQGLEELRSSRESLLIEIQRIIKSIDEGRDTAGESIQNSSFRDIKSSLEGLFSLLQKMDMGARFTEETSINEAIGKRSQSDSMVLDLAKKYFNIEN